MQVDQRQVGQLICQLSDHVDLLLLGRLVDGGLRLEVVDRPTAARGAVRRARAQQGGQPGLVPCGGQSSTSASAKSSKV